MTGQWNLAMWIFMFLSLIMPNEGIFFWSRTTTSHPTTGHFHTHQHQAHGHTHAQGQGHIHQGQPVTRPVHHSPHVRKPHSSAVVHHKHHVPSRVSISSKPRPPVVGAYMHGGRRLPHFGRHAHFHSHHNSRPRTSRAWVW